MEYKGQKLSSNKSTCLLDNKPFALILIDIVITGSQFIINYF